MVDIGEISSGTLRTQDLLPPFVHALTEAIAEQKARDVFEACALIVAANEAVAEYARLDRDGTAPDYLFEERAQGILQDLQDALEEYAPAFCYVGTTDGDGACFGVWPSVESFEQACADGEAVKLESVPDHIGIVSDHGNLTVYAVTVSEVWAVV